MTVETMNAADRTFSWLLIIGSVLHGFGAVNEHHDQPEIMVWALAVTLAGLLLAALNLLRIGRPGDRVLAWMSFAGCLGWLAEVIGFGVASGKGSQLPIVAMALIAVVLAIFSFRSATGTHSIS